MTHTCKVLMPPLTNPTSNCSPEKSEPNITVSITAPILQDIKHMQLMLLIAISNLNIVYFYVISGIEHNFTMIYNYLYPSNELFMPVECWDVFRGRSTRGGSLLARWKTFIHKIAIKVKKQVSLIILRTTTS